jgi:hypothetical protein
MSQFNITNSKVDQLSNSGNNYKNIGQGGQVAMSEQGNAVLTQGTNNKVQVDHKEGFWTLLWSKLKGCWKWIISCFGVGKP